MPKVNQKSVKSRSKISGIIGKKMSHHGRRRFVEVRGHIACVPNFALDAVDGHSRCVRDVCERRRDVDKEERRVCTEALHIAHQPSHGVGDLENVQETKNGADGGNQTCHNVRKDWT